MPNTTSISRFGFVNAYVVHEDDGLTLVDAMLPRSGKAILAAATPKARRSSGLRSPTPHTDHIGALDDPAADLPDAEVIISARDARFLAKDMTLDPDEPQVQGARRLSRRGRRPARPSSAGARIGSLEVIASPGHTRGHVSIFDPRDGTLVAAATLRDGGRRRDDRADQLEIPAAGMGTWPRPTELGSARRLRQLNPARLPRARQDRREPGRGDGSRDRRAGQRVPRRGSIASRWSTPPRGWPTTGWARGRWTGGRRSSTCGRRRCTSTSRAAPACCGWSACAGWPSCTPAIPPAADDRSGGRGAAMCHSRLSGFALTSPGLYTATLAAPPGDDAERRRPPTDCSACSPRCSASGSSRATSWSRDPGHPQRPASLRDPRAGGRLRDTTSPQHLLRAADRDAGGRPRSDLSTAPAPSLPIEATDRGPCPAPPRLAGRKVVIPALGVPTPPTPLRGSASRTERVRVPSPRGQTRCVDKQHDDIPSPPRPHVHEADQAVPARRTQPRTVSRATDPNAPTGPSVEKHRLPPHSTHLMRINRDSHTVSARRDSDLAGHRDGVLRTSPER